MRLIPVLLISVALATSAGCFGKDDENGGGSTTTPTPTGTTPTGPGTTPTGATPTTPTTGGNTTTPTKPAPKELCALSFSFSGNTQAGAPPTHVTTAACGSVTAGYTTLTLSGNFTAASGAPVYAAEGISVTIVDAAGTAVASCAGPSAGAAAPVACTGSGSVMVGEYSVTYNGVGNVDFAGTATIS